MISFIKKLFGILAALLLATSSLNAQVLEPGDAILFYGIERTPYACTGVGESRLDPRWDNYPLKLIFTAAGTAYISDVAVKITDERGRLVLDVRCETPWLVAQLEPGTYQIEAIAQNQHAQKATIRVNPGTQTSRVIRFPEIEPAPVGR